MIIKKQVKIADSVNEFDWNTKNMCIVEADGKKITLAKQDNNLFAFAHKCPHAGGIMADGFIDALGNAVCPLHRYKFNLKTGRNTTGEEYLKTYKTAVNETGVFVIFEEKKWF
jgi:3-phenylpropionate/trans-cinnamate dioxygenase ferredoxin subunit